MPPTSASGSRAHCGLLSAMLLLGACSEPPAKFATDTSAATACIVDEDGDGYGLGCRLGDDCDDGDPSVDTECRACARPTEGCDCETGTAPVECFTQKLKGDDSLLCTQGQLFCRDGTWSACEGANVFEVPVAEARATTFGRALVGDAGSMPCSPCRPGCFPINDDLAAADGPLDATNSSATVYAPGGGITLRATSEGTPQRIDTGMQCTQPGAPPDADCDGIPDTADDVTGLNTSYGSTRATIFMDLLPGESENASVELPFHLRSADVYFLLDGSESMAGMATPLAAAINAGSYLDPSVACADTDLDGAPNDELKTQGLAGNIRCLVPGAEFGAGWVREIPFLGPDANGVPFGDADERAFEQRVDVGSDLAALEGALRSFSVDPNHGGGNAQMLGLSLVATGEESYVGWDRPALPARIGCPAATFGYPCFRDSALPIVVMMTGEPLHNGPVTSSGNLGSDVPNAYPAGIHAEQVEAGSYPHYLPVANTNEAFDSAFDTASQVIESGTLGAIGNDFVTFTGNTESMATDVDAAQLGCPGLTAEGPEAVFRFSVAQRKTLRLSTAGTRFDSVLGIVRADAPITGSTPPLSFDFTTPAGAGDTTPNELGRLPLGVSAEIVGDSAGTRGDYPREVLGCYENTTFVPFANSTDYAPDVAFRFNVEQDMDLAFQVGAEASPKSLSLFRGAPNVVDVEVAANAERLILPYDLSRAAVRLISGYDGAGATRKGQSLSTVGLDAELSVAPFVAVGCDPGGVADLAPDTVVDFSLNLPTRVRIETSGDGAGMGASFEHMLGLRRRNGTSNATPHQVPNAVNETRATAYAVAENTFAAAGWASISGTLWNESASALMAADYSQAQVGGTSGCGLRGGGASTAPDAVVAFTLDQTRTLTFDTQGTSFRTYLSLHHATDMASDNHNDTQATAQDLGTLNGKRWTVTGSTAAPAIRQDYSPLETDATQVASVRAEPASLGCNTDSADAVFKFSLSTATDVELSTLGSGYDTVLALYDSRGPEHFEIVGNAYAYPAVRSCNDDNPASPFSTASRLVLNDLAAGTYYVVVAGYQANAGNYQLQVTDLQAPTLNSMPLIACDSGSLPADTERSQITQTLSPGKYYLVLKGDVTASSPNHDYEINIRGAAGSDELVACGYRNLGAQAAERAVIEEELPAGDYSVVIRGAHAADAGDYRLLIRDVGYAPVERGCHDTSPGHESSFTSFLAARDDQGDPIDYWLVMRGLDASAANAVSDPYSIYIRDPALGLPLDTCSQSAAGSFTGTLEPGAYYAVVKGQSAADRGWYQLSMGDPERVNAADYTDLASYPEARDALTGNGVRVIGAQIGSDTNLSEQLSSLASDTQAVDAMNAPLVVQVDPSDPQLSTALSTQIVSAIDGLAEGVRMNVSMRLDPGPSFPTRPFSFSATAVDTGTDGCEPPINQVHQACGAGATPAFSVSFGNPAAPNDVPPNPADPKGGYYMTLELVGDGRYVLERIPVYLVPTDVAAERPRMTYVAAGSYWQEVPSTQCVAPEAPTWTRLSWDAALPSGTSMTWKLCTAPTEAELGACSLHTLATVTAGGACAANADCQDGFCVGNVCQYAVGPACDADADCGRRGVCRDYTCRWTALPIDPAPALTDQDAGHFLRVELDMQASADRQRAPVLYDWHVDYECNASE